MLWWLLGAVASAGTGPWVLAPGDGAVYVGLESQRFSRLALGDGSFTDSVLQVDQGVQTFIAKTIATVGLGRRLELEFELPVTHVFAPVQGDICTLGLADGCAPTTGLGPIVVRGEGQVLDEVFGAPLSMSLGLDLRFGQTTAGSRSRITNIGEGTFDLEPRIAFGKAGGLGRKGGYYSLSLDVGFRWRMPLRTQFAGVDSRFPGFEVTGGTEALLSPIPIFGFGPALGWIYRPNGYDVEDLLAGEGLWADPDRFLALRIGALTAGGKVIFRGSDRVSVVFSVLHTLYARNNPTNVLQLGAGVQVRGLRVRKQEG
jgi:hypothetical protein